MKILLLGWIFTFTNSLLIYVIAILVARWFGAAAYGDYAVAVASITLFGTAATLGLGRSSLNILRVYRERAEWNLYYGYIRFSLIFTIVSSILLILTLIEGFGIYDKYFRSMEHNVSRIHVYFIPLAAVVYFLYQVLIASKRFIFAITILRIQFPIVVFILLFVFQKLIPDITVKYAVIAYGLSWVLCIISLIAVFTITHTRRIYTTNVQYKARYWLSLAYPFFMNAIVLLALPYIALIILELLHYAESATGFFAAVLRTAAFVLILSRLSDRYYLPEVSSAYHRRDWEEMNRILLSRFRMLVGLCTLYLIIMFAFGKYLLGLFGEGFEDQYFILIVFTIGIILGIFGGISNNIMQVLGNKNLAFNLSFLMLVLTIAIGFVLIPPLGVEGAVITLIVSTLFVNIIEVMYLWRVHGVKVI